MESTREMNALEMAEAMEGRARVRRKITNRENTGDSLSDQLEQAATMLRQQQAEIEELKAKLKLHEAMDNQCASLMQQFRKASDI
jgi:Tfp pilus assembly protein PilN